MTCFRDLVGQDAPIRELRTELEKGRLNHSYLFEGPTGTGRCTLASALAGRMLCENPTPEDACGVCDGCKMFAEGNHPDFLELPRDVRELSIRRFAERSGSGSSSESIDHDPVLNFLHLKPVIARQRVCLIPDAERMRNESANAFLKTLEEPPGGSLILLTTAARDRLLATIVSRCRRVAVRPLPEEVLRSEIERRELAEGEAAASLAILAEGSLGVAEDLASGEAVEIWRWLESGLAPLTPVQAVELGDGLVERVGRGGDANAKRMRALRLLDMLALRIRRNLRQGLSPRAAAKVLDALWTAGERIHANVRPELSLRVAALETIATLKRG